MKDDESSMTKSDQRLIPVTHACERLGFRELPAAVGGDVGGFQPHRTLVRMWLGAPRDLTAPSSAHFKLSGRIVWE